MWNGQPRPAARYRVREVQGSSPWERTHHPPPLPEGTIIRKIIAAITAAIALAFGAIVTAAPAQAVWGTTVHLEAVPASHPNAWIKSENMIGTEKILHTQDTARNSRRFGPPGSNWRMLVQGPAGTFRYVEHGEWYTPTNDGVYQVWLELQP